MGQTVFIPPIKLTSPRGRVLLDLHAMEIPPGQTLAICGPSGAGKTLFLHSLFGMATVGQASVLDPRKRQFLMIQDPGRGLTPGLTLWGHFQEILPAKPLRSAAAQALLDMGLEGTEFLDRQPHQISGGEAQRAMLALILIQSPTCLVCDEPAASLDAQNENMLLSRIRKHQRRLGFTLVFVTHQPHLIDALADQVLLMENGKRVFFGCKSDFFSRSNSDFHTRLLSFYRDLLSVRPTAAEKHPPGHDCDSPESTHPEGIRTRQLEFKEIQWGFSRAWLSPSLNATISRGSWWWVTGPSGSGKTTLTRMITGILPPRAGTIWWEGTRLPSTLRQRHTALRRSIQPVMQHGSLCFNPARSVESQLRAAFAKDTSRMNALLREAGLAYLDLGVKPVHLSLGEHQRLNLIRALATRPQLLICDELFSSLDWPNRLSLLRLIESEQTHSGCTVILTTHDRELVRLHPGCRLSLPQARISWLAADAKGPDSLDRDVP